MENLIQTLRRYRVVPVVTVDAPDRAVTLARLLVESGLPLVEVTFRTPAAAEAVRQVRNHLPDMVIGAGTVLRPEQAQAAMDAGADFLVAPGFNPRMVDFCLEQGFPFIPGVDSPSLIEAALDRGLSLVKFFPAEASGGIRYIKAVAGPYGTLHIMPTGGIDDRNIQEYLAWDKVAACGASWIAPAGALASGDFHLIAKRIGIVQGILKQMQNPC